MPLGVSNMILSSKPVFTIIFARCRLQSWSSTCVTCPTCSVCPSVLDTSDNSWTYMTYIICPRVPYPLCPIWSRSSQLSIPTLPFMSNIHLARICRGKNFDRANKYFWNVFNVEKVSIYYLATRIFLGERLFCFDSLPIILMLSGFLLTIQVFLITLTTSIHVTQKVFCLTI